MGFFLFYIAELWKTPEPAFDRKITDAGIADQERHVGACFRHPRTQGTS